MTPNLLEQRVPYFVVCVIAVFIYTFQTLSGCALQGKSKVLNFLGYSGPLIRAAQSFIITKDCAARINESL